MGDVSKKDMERIKEIYGLFKDKGADGFDAFFLGPLLRALGLNPSCQFIEGLGGTAKPGGKVITLDEFVVAFTQARDNKDQGVYEDFIECLKLYDKLENGYMPAAELTHYLCNLGERLTPEECDEVCRDCMDEEDDDGNIPYIPFLARMCEKPVPINKKPM